MKEWGEAGIFSQMTLFVEETCRLFQYGMEWEDCLQTGWLALEEARKSYPRVCGRYPFWDYVFLKIRDGIQSAQKEWYNGRPYKTVFGSDAAGRPPGNRLYLSQRRMCF